MEKERRGLDEKMFHYQSFLNFNKQCIIIIYFEFSKPIAPLTSLQ